MANEVVINGNKVYIKDSNEKRIKKTYHSAGPAYIKISKNFIEVTSHNRLIAKVFKLHTFARRKVININTLQILHKEKITSFFPYFSYIIFDYVYLNTGNNTLYDEKNAAVLNDICETELIDKVKYTALQENLLIVTHSTKKYSLIRKSSVLIYNADQILLYSKGNKILVLKDSFIYIYDSFTMNCILKVEIDKAEKYNVDLISNLQSTEAIYIKYLTSNNKCKKTEIRSLDDVTKVVKIPNSKSISSYNGYLEVYDSKWKQILNLKTLEFLSEELATEILILNDNKNRKYLVLKCLNKISVYSLAEYKLIISGNYTNIYLSQNNDYFILEDYDLKGVATLNGEVKLEPLATELYETIDSFYFYDKPQNKLKKELEK